MLTYFSTGPRGPARTPARHNPTFPNPPPRLPSPHHHFHLPYRLPRRLHRDPHVLPERGEKLHQPPDREIAGAVAHQRSSLLRSLAPCSTASTVISSAGSSTVYTTIYGGSTSSRVPSTSPGRPIWDSPAN